MPTLLLVNPGSRRGSQQFERYRRQLAKSLNLVDACLTDSSQHMVDRIKKALGGHIQRFVIGGGDGTLSAAANALAGTHGILGVLPLGTGNTFSSGLELPTSPHDLVRLLAQGPLAQYDLGQAQKGEVQVGFLNSLTMGFSERLVELLSTESKNRLGRLAWAVEFHRALVNTPTLHITVTWPGGQDIYDTRQLVIANGRTIAAGIAATPISSGQDGLLEVFRLGGPSFISIVKLGTKLLAGTLFTDPEACYRTVPEVTVESDPPLPVSIDGEVWFPPPLICRVVPASLWVICPSKTGKRTKKIAFNPHDAANWPPPSIPPSHTDSLKGGHNPPAK